MAKIINNNSNEITIGKHLFKMLLIESFRYCLGRRTGIASECCERLATHWQEIPEFHNQIKRDIQRAIDIKGAGDPEDIAEWRKILTLESLAEGK